MHVEPIVAAPLPPPGFASKITQLFAEVDALAAKVDGLAETALTEARVRELIGAALAPIADKAEEARQVAGACQTMTTGIQGAYGSHKEELRVMRTAAMHADTKVGAVVKELQEVTAKIQRIVHGYHDGQQQQAGLKHVINEVVQLKKRQRTEGKGYEPPAVSSPYQPRQPRYCP